MSLKRKSIVSTLDHMREHRKMVHVQSQTNLYLSLFNFRVPQNGIILIAEGDFKVIRSSHPWHSTKEAAKTQRE